MVQRVAPAALPAIWASLQAIMAFAAMFLLSFRVRRRADRILANERRLLAIEDELKVARELRFSILHKLFPRFPSLRIADLPTRPMAAVAGDFYEFIPVDGMQVGFLVADVTGHGVPAALIASMIKVAMKSVVTCAHEPRQVLRGLNHILYGQLRDQLVSDVYLAAITGNRKALYSAAGHPPLLRWREGKLERIQSNGLLFGVNPEADYPVCDLSIHTGDRFLLYTDGVTEPQNASGDSFGDQKAC